MSHIIPFSLARFSSDTEHHRLSVTWANIYRYFPNMLNFRLENINDEQSVMMLTAPLHAEFGSFNLTLDLMEAPHTYDTRSSCTQSFQEPTGFSSLRVVS